MKAYLVTAVIIDHEGMGAEDILEMLSRTRHINPHVVSIKEADIGEWHDDHPLNNGKTISTAVKELFANAQDC